MCIPSNRNGNQLHPDKLLIQKQLQEFKRFETCQPQTTRDETYAKLFYAKMVKCFKYFEIVPAKRFIATITQQTHLATAIAVITVAFIVNPKRREEKSSTLLNFIHLGSFATYLGTQIWMTFMSGLTLYFSLPRHHFGDVQKVLFPKYFTFNSALCFVMLAIFTRNQSCENQENQTSIQVFTLAASFLINLLIRLYLTPPLLRLIVLKNNLERNAGIGMEVGHQNLGPLKQCPSYVPVHKSFRKVHTAIALGNVATMAFSIFHLYFLSSKLCFL